MVAVYPRVTAVSVAMDDSLPRTGIELSVFYGGESAGKYGSLDTRRGHTDCRAKERDP